MLNILQTQGIFHASTLVLIICAPLNAFLNYLLVWNKSIGLGFIGAPISVVITNWIMCFMLYGYIFVLMVINVGLNMNIANFIIRFFQTLE